MRDEPEVGSQLAWISDEVLGVYENPPGLIPPAVAIAEDGLYLLYEDTCNRIEFGAIMGAVGPEKNSAGMIKLNTLAGEIQFPIGWRKGKFEDAFEFLRFICRVLESRRDR